MFKQRTWAGLVLGLAWVAIFGTGSALADTISFDITVPNAALAPFTGPYGTVLVNRTSPTTADITLTSNTVSPNIYLFGDGSTLGLNTNGAVSVGTITGTNAGTGFSPGPFTSGGPKNVDGAGSFDFVIDDFDGFTNAVDSLMFTLTLSSGTWASAGDVLTPNLSGFSVAGHVFVTTSPANASNTALATGFAANGGTGGGQGGLTEIPGPGSLMLLGVGLTVVGVANWAYKRRRPA